VPVLEFYFIGDYLYYRWTNVEDNFKMTIKITLDDKRIIVLFPTTKTQLKEIGECKYFTFSSDWQLFGEKKNKELQKEIPLPN
jgi:hypothetical protein